jgi:hypothetical protein
MEIEVAMQFLVPTSTVPEVAVQVLQARTAHQQVRYQLRVASVANQTSQVSTPTTQLVAAAVAVGRMNGHRVVPAVEAMVEASTTAQFLPQVKQTPEAVVAVDKTVLAEQVDLVLSSFALRPCP